MPMRSSSISDDPAAKLLAHEIDNCHLLSVIICIGMQPAGDR